jgi:hypothetical protein
VFWKRERRGRFGPGAAQTAHRAQVRVLWREFLICSAKQTRQAYKRRMSALQDLSVRNDIVVAKTYLKSFEETGLRLNRF